MPRLRPHPFLSTSLLVAALVLFSASTLLAQPLSNPKGKPAKPKTMTWVLSRGTVADSGQQTGDGLPIYVGHATATARGQARVKTGVFTIRYFVKDGEMRGTWDITKAGTVKKAYRSPDNIKGALLAKANPDGSIDGKVLVGPQRRHAGKEDKAEGRFTGDDKFNGTISVTRK